MSGKRRSFFTLLIALGILVVVLGGFAAVLVMLRPSPEVIATCRAGTYEMDPVQAENAALIASVAQKRDLPPRAVTVAIAVAMQESRLRNLDHGDRDSLGLFQQRPSQGWGTEAQVQDPLYAAGAFFSHLVKVKGWQDLAVTVAGQKVQRSGRPNAYAQWEPRATAMAQALTGQVPAGMSCQYAKSDIAVPASGLSTTMESDAAKALGGPVLGVDLAPERGWLAVTWLMSRAADYQIAGLTYAGHTWDARTGKWSAADTNTPRIEVERTRAKS